MAVIAEETTRSEDTALVGGSVMSGLEFDFDHAVSEIWKTEINLKFGDIQYFSHISGRYTWQAFLIEKARACRPGSGFLFQEPSPPTL